MIRGLGSGDEIDWLLGNRRKVVGTFFSFFFSTFYWFGGSLCMLGVK